MNTNRETEKLRWLLSFPILMNSGIDKLARRLPKPDAGLFQNRLDSYQFVSFVVLNFRIQA
jgi:hypothetical protein